VVSPEPFASESEALAEMEAMESDVLKGLPWEKYDAGMSSWLLRLGIMGNRDPG
jgi:hypothetical protein